MAFCLATGSAYGGEARQLAVQIVTIQHSEIWSQGHLELIPEVYASDFVGHFPGGTVRGHDGIRSRVEAHRKAFPDWHEEIVDLIVDGDKVATRFISSGTNLGPFLGSPPTGNSVEISEAAIFLVRHGRISEQWVYPDIGAMQSQLSRGGATSRPSDSGGDTSNRVPGRRTDDGFR